MLALSICPRRSQVKLRVAQSSQRAGRVWHARAAVATKLATPSPCARAAPVLRCPLVQEVDCEAELILATLMESHSLPRMADTAQQPAHTGAQGAWAADSWLQAGQQAVPSNRGAPSVSGLRDGAGPSMPRSTGEQGPRVVGDAGAVCEQGVQGTGRAGPYIVVRGGGSAAGKRCTGTARNGAEVCKRGSVGQPGVRCGARCSAWLSLTQRACWLAAGRVEVSRGRRDLAGASPQPVPSGLLDDPFQAHSGRDGAVPQQSPSHRTRPSRLGMGPAAGLQQDTATRDRVVSRWVAQLGRAPQL